MANKQVSTEVLQELTNKIQDIVNNYCWNLEHFTDSEVDDFFQASADEVTYYNGLINDNIESKNFLWSSKNVADKIAQAIIKADSYADNLVKNISSIKLKYVTALPTSDISENTIYILKATDSTSKDTLNLYNATDGWTSIGSFDISLDDYYTKTETDSKLDEKANKTEVISNDKINQTLDSTTNSTDTVLSTIGLQTEMDKKVDKTNIVTSVDSSSTDEQVVSAKTVYTELDKKMINDYYTNNNTKKGIVFDNNADGSYFTLRPYLPQNIFQITKNDTQALLNIYSDGTIKSKGNRNINDLVVAYTNELTNAFLVDTSTSESALNNAGIITSATSNKPSDMEYGIREVLWVAQNKVIIRITGVDTSGMPAIWVNRYNGTDWATWRKL